MTALSEAHQPYTPELVPALQRYFGFPEFRAGQEEIVRRAVEGRDTLALMPTGAGKSLCYQLAAMLRPTPTLVLSPLIALMKDQVDNLPPEVRDHTTLINSSLDAGEASRRLRELGAGRYKLLYAAPERLRQRSFVNTLRGVDLGLVVIDEVHCVSMWGHDFRPDYMFIRRALADLGDPVVLGLTATATPATETDIARSLGRELEVVRASVVRPNLRYEVEHVENEDERLRTTLNRATTLSGPGIIYARSREKCEQVAQVLVRNGVRALHYHAGLESGDRTRVQENFLSDRARVIVATTAFGMGIDKRDIRWVLLYNFPNSLESYVQMVGRAGRNGDTSTCVLLASASDATNLRRFARADVPTVEQLRSVYRSLRARSEEDLAEVEPQELGREASLGEDEDSRVLVGMLERAALVRRDYDAGRAMRVRLVLPAPADTPQRIQQLLAAYDQLALDRAERMIAFADSHSCRHLQVAEHFGESVATPCGMCDACLPGERSSTPPSPSSRPLPENIAAAILDAVEELRWPLGVRGLTLLLRGSVTAPPSAQRSPSFGVLSAARESTVKRWITRLTEGGHLESFESEDGYRFLRVGSRDNLPQLSGLPARRDQPRRSRSRLERVQDDATSSADDGELYERLRAWRLVRAREAGVAAFIIMSNRVLTEIATLRPANTEELLDIPGLGSRKVEQYGEELLAVLRSST